MRWKNLLSYGARFTEISLDKSPNTLIIGSNGAGKSTVLDALTYSLFGRPFRNVNKPQLINSINQKDCVVEIEFEVGKNHYRVCRGLKPSLFEIYLNGSLIDQTAKAKDQQRWLEQTILKLNYKTFCQVVVLGSASYVPFMELTAASRRAVVEDVLDIQIFSLMNILLKQRLSTLKTQYNENDYSINITEEKVELQKEYTKNLKKLNSDNLQSNKDRIIKSKDDIATYRVKIDAYQKEANKLLAKMVNKDKTENSHRSLVEYGQKITQKITKIRKEISFYEKKDTCPTCQQGIDEVFKTATIESKKIGLDELESGFTSLQTKMDEVSASLDVFGQLHIEMQNNEVQIQEANNSVTAINNYIQKVQSEIDELLEAKETVGDEVQDKLNTLTDELAAHEKQKVVILEDQHYHSIVGIMLKDTGIKTKIIKQYLPIMNKLINKYLSDMDFFVNFTLDESFNETIKSRYRDEFSYASFSEGEKFRINVALLLTWREIAKMKNSASTNLLIMDEVFDSSLDATGSDEVLKLIKYMKGINVFVISHKTDTLLDKFDNVLKFSKPKNFSQLESV